MLYDHCYGYQLSYQLMKDWLTEHQSLEGLSSPLKKSDFCGPLNVFLHIRQFWWGCHPLGSPSPSPPSHISTTTRRGRERGCGLGPASVGLVLHSRVYWLRERHFLAEVVWEWESGHTYRQTSWSVGRSHTHKDTLLLHSGTSCWLLSEVIPSRGFWKVKKHQYSL